MTIKLAAPFVTTFLGLCLCSSSIAYAAGIDGAWATDPSRCKDLYIKNGKMTSFSKNSDLYGSGFIIEGNQIRGKIATCNIKVRKKEGAVLNLVAACSTDVAVETVQFMLKAVSDSKIVRMYPGLSELDTTYERCSW